MCQGPCVLQTVLPALALCPQPRAALREAPGHPAGWDSRKQLDFGTPPPLGPPSRSGPSPPPQGGSGSQKVSRPRRGERTAGRRAAKSPARRARTGRRRAGHAGALGPRGSMKGGGRPYPRGPSLGWLLAKCCCCFPCRGEWQPTSAPSFSQRLGRPNAREGWEKGGWVAGGGRGGSWLRTECISVSLRYAPARAEFPLGCGAAVCKLLHTYQRLWMSGRQPAGERVGCGGWGDAVACGSQGGRVTLPGSHLHMDLSCGIH